jgi:alkylation response protein AidB-like acyl-CoA dehydrogenase
MNFAFSDEQDMLRAQARGFVDKQYPIERVAAIADGVGFKRSEWADVSGLGWTGISVPENEGGAGLGFLEEAIVSEELGRALYPGPFFGTVILALPLLRLAGASDLVQGIVAGERIATVAWAGEDGRFDVDPPPKVRWDGERISCLRLFVPDLAAADLVVVVGWVGGGVGVWAVDRSAVGVGWRELSTVDTTRRLGEVTFEGTPARVLISEADPKLLESLRDRALAALAVEAVGVGSRALEVALSYARTRVQFGRPIGAYQAVSHPLAQAFVELETSRSLAYWAAWAVAEGEPGAGRAAAAARARAGDATVAACERAIQAHGGIGFTWDHPLHRYYKRALGIAHTMGTAAELRARVAAELLD